MSLVMPAVHVSGAFERHSAQNKSYRRLWHCSRRYTRLDLRWVELVHLSKLANVL